MSTDRGDDGSGELGGEQADQLLDRLLDRAEERDDITIGRKRGFSRRETLAGLLGLGGLGTAAMSQRAQAAGESWSNSSGTVGTDSQPLQAVNAQDVHAQSVESGEISGGVAPSPISNLAGDGLEVDASGNLIAPSDGSGSATGSLTLDAQFGDGVWCWFGGPIGIYDSQSDTTYMGWLTSGGDAVAGAYDHANDAVSTTTLQSGLQVDDHANPAILFRDDGRLTYFYSAHNGSTIYYRTTSNARDISSFDTEQSVAPSTEHDYENPRERASDGRIYVWFRNEPNSSAYIYSDDGGSTWSSGTSMVTTSQRIVYHQYSKMSNGAVSAAYSETETGLNNEDGVRNVYYARYDSTDDTLYDAAGNSLGTPPLDVTNTDLVYDSAANNENAWVWDVAYHGGNPEIVWAVKSDSSYTPHTYYWARWDGSSWITSEVADGGQYITDGNDNQRFYSGGIALDKETPGRVYYASIPSSTTANTFVAETSDAGSTWDRDLISAPGETQARPHTVWNHQAELPAMWFRGTYNTFTDYQTNAISGFGAGPATRSVDGDSGGSSTITRGFESGDFSNWSLADSGAFSIVQSPVYEGTYAAQSTESSTSSMTTTVTADAYSALSFATYNDTATLAEARPIVKFQDGGASGTQVIDIAIDDSGVVGDSGSVIINEGGGYVDTGANITGGAWYRHDITNIDWTNDQYDYALVDNSGTQVVSGSYSFKNSASQIDAAFAKLNPELVTVDSFEFTP